MKILNYILVLSALTLTSAQAKLTDAEDEAQIANEPARYVLFDQRNGESCFIEAQDNPSFKGAKSEDAAGIQSAIESAKDVESFKAMKECSGENRQVVNNMVRELNTGTKTAGLPFLVGYYMVCSAVNAGTLYANTAGEKGFMPFILGGGLSLTFCGPVTGTNYLIYYVGSEVVNALKSEDKKD